MPKKPRIKGKIELSGDKSISHRAVLFSALSGKKSVLRNISKGEDVKSTVACLAELGIEAKFSENNQLKLEGNIAAPRNKVVLNAGNSGTTMRLMTGLLAGLNIPAELRGDNSLSRRPMRRVVKPLAEMGAEIELSPEGTAPVVIKESKKLKAAQMTLEVPSAQVKSAVLLASAFAGGVSTLKDPFNTRDHTERMLNLPVENGVIEVNPAEIVWPGGDIFIPGDISSAAFFITFALISGFGELTIEKVSLNPGRTAYLDILKSMGGDISVISEGNVLNEPYGNISVKPSAISGGIIPPEISASIIDEIPALSMLALHSRDGIEFRGVEELKYKESNRIEAIMENVKSMGGKAEEIPGGFRIYPLKTEDFTPFGIKTYYDHRIAMSMYLAGLSYGYEPPMDNPGVVVISFPEFFAMVGKAAVWQ